MINGMEGGGKETMMVALDGMEKVDAVQRSQCSELARLELMLRTKAVKKKVENLMRSERAQ